MNNTELKQILVQIARLPKHDQRWIINALSTKQRQLFQQVNGKSQLEQAKRFRQVDARSLLHLKPPLAQKALALYSPLYIAVVLEQGQYPWEEDFLQCFDDQNKIRNLLLAEVKTLKAKVKQILFQQWENSLSFESHLESHHG